jgi:threonine synthase
MCKASGGSGHLVTDDEVFDLQKKLAMQEGIYCEPAGAVALAGALKAVKQGIIPKDEPVICLVTGHGFKDAASIDRITKAATNKYFTDFQDSIDYISSKCQ